MDTKIDIDNALELYETLDVNDHASDLYFDKIIMQEGLADNKAAKKVLEFFYKKNDFATTKNAMESSMLGMINAIKSSPWVQDEATKANDLKVLEGYKAQIDNVLNQYNAAMEQLKAAKDAMDKDVLASNKANKAEDEKAASSDNTDNAEDERAEDTTDTESDEENGSEDEQS